MNLAYKADRKTVAYLLVTTALFFFNWFTPLDYSLVNIILFAWAGFMAVSVAVIAHNHNHVPIWKERWMNSFTDYWITLFYGFPAFGWIPTHNRNHHALNNREGDYTITYRYGESNNLMTLTSYPAISSYHQQKPIRDYLKHLWKVRRSTFWECIFQYVALGAAYVAVFYLDWQKAIIFFFIPHQIALFSILVFNYLQHVHADEESKFNHSRNFVGFLNTLLFNNGYHTVHHLRANVHWSKTPELHEEFKDQIEPSLNEPRFWGYILRTYFLAPFAKQYQSRSMRAERMKNIAAS